MLVGLEDRLEVWSNDALDGLLKTKKEQIRRGLEALFDEEAAVKKSNAIGPASSRARRGQSSAGPVPSTDSWGGDRMAGQEAHAPVMVAEVMDLLTPSPGDFTVETMVGAGGHAAEFLRRTSPDGRLLGIDRDPAILEVARRALEPFKHRATLREGCSDALRDILAEAGAGAPQIVFMDLGVSSLQLDDPARGFSIPARRAARHEDVGRRGDRGRPARQALGRGARRASSGSTATSRSPAGSRGRSSNAGKPRVSRRPGTSPTSSPGSFPGGSAAAAGSTPRPASSRRSGSR